MSFNGISGAINEPGQIPWEIVLLYFILALFFVFYYGKKTGGLKAFSTLDLVYIGIGAAFSVAWEFFIGRYIGKFLPNSPFIDVGFWGRLVIIFIVAALVRKVGAGMLTLLIFNLLSDIFYYGFGGEPMFTIYESLTYGLFIDLMIAATGGKIFGIGVTPKNGGSSLQRANLISRYLAIVEGGILGLLWAIPDPIFYSGFFGPFIYAYAPNWAHIVFDLFAFIPADIVFGIIAGLLALRIVRAVGQ
ncbi:hypothetical protein EWF20_07080 [Sulfolobus sp. S-194]|uniref:hypothetical protein n=1 Tax=Sulfolobus sp. S-194 TaxID=2512240 RepID=UPI001437063F|nr:hypothetical protein [Sulfolobus sp. S-194]QIW23937.1 hypothetical protein EWF20_07080 [Sulfolobus sp. S-194]